MTDKEFLDWIITRLTNIFGDDPNADFIHRLRKIADKIDYLDKTNYHTIVEQSDYLKKMENN